MDDSTLFIAKIASAYLLVTGLGFLISTDFYERMVHGSANRDPVILNLSGAVHFLIGMIILLNHFRWNMLPEAVVSLIGIAAVLKGAALIAVPKLTIRSNRSGKPVFRSAGIVFIVVGAYLGYVGYS